MISAYRKYRLLEMIPGTLTWTTLICVFTFSFLFPVHMMFFVIAFDFYWMIKVIYISTFLVISFRKYKMTMKKDWHAETSAHAKYDDMYHLVMIPNSSESREVVETTMASLAKSTFPIERIIIAFAAEERYPSSVENGNAMQEKYGTTFGHFLVTTHPSDIAGEIAGKGANLTWAGKQIKQQVIDVENIPYENIIVSVFDVDTITEAQFFDYLTHTYLAQSDPTRCSYQPIPMFNNNIWDAPAIMRVAASGTTFWLMAEQIRPERLFTFSSHSMSFKAVVDVGWWQTDIVSDDSRIFLQCFLRYNGNYSVVPLHMPVYMDTVLSESWSKSLVNLYKQQRRWAWGSENLPYMIWHFYRNGSIPLRKRLYHLFNQLEGMWSWGTASLIIFFAGYIPLLFISPAEQTTVIAQNAPYVLQYILTIANIGLILSVVLGTLILPHRPSHHRPRKYAFMILQWALLPISMTIFGSIPAIESQTRLLLGKYLGFYVTEKSRRSN